MRPRLLNSFLAEIACLDAVATRADDPDGAGSLTSGYDDDFGEVIVTDEVTRISARQEQASIFLPCEIMTEDYEKLQQVRAGNVVGQAFDLVFAAKDLVCKDQVRRDNGELLIRTSDRLVSIRDRCKVPILTPPNPPGLFAVEVKPLFGLAQRGDLWIITFRDREQFVRQ